MQKLKNPRFILVSPVSLRCKINAGQRKILSIEPQKSISGDFSRSVFFFFERKKIFP